jgi:hypothetical protein
MRHMEYLKYFFGIQAGCHLCHVEISNSSLYHLELLMRLSLLSGLFLATLSGVFAAEDSDVIDLTGANFDSIVKPAELILVEFFAPW